MPADDCLNPKFYNLLQSVHLVIEESGMFVGTVPNYSGSSLRSSYGLEHAVISLYVREYERHLSDEFSNYIVLFRFPLL